MLMHIAEKYKGEHAKGNENSLSFLNAYTRHLFRVEVCSF